MQLRSRSSQPLRYILEQDGKGNTGMDMDVVAGIWYQMILASLLPWWKLWLRWLRDYENEPSKSKKQNTDAFKLSVITVFVFFFHHHGCLWQEGSPKQMQRIVLNILRTHYISELLLHSSAYEMSQKGVYLNPVVSKNLFWIALFFHVSQFPNNYYYDFYHEYRSMCTSMQLK